MKGISGPKFDCLCKSMSGSESIDHAAERHSPGPESELSEKAVTMAYKLELSYNGCKPVSIPADFVVKDIVAVRFLLLGRVGAECPKALVNKQLFQSMWLTQFGCRIKTKRNS